jgi:SNF2 family DNA or RNA helicase
MTTADVRLRTDRGGIEIVPHEGSAAELAQRIRGVLPGIRLRSRRAFVEASFADGVTLLILDLPMLHWEQDAQRAVTNRRQAREAADRVLAAAERIRQSDPRAVRAALGPRPLLDILDDHQIVNVALMTIPDGWGSCVFDEQGTGKTPAVIASFDVLVERNEADVLLVVAPKSMVAEWATEFQRFTGDLYRVAVLEGSRADRARALASGADVIVVNYEGAIALQDDLRLLALRSRVVLAVDESFNVKNPDAARTSAVGELREWCTRCFALCGTPAPNVARDIVAQVDLVDFGLTFESVGRYDEPEHERAAIRASLTRHGIFSRNLKADVLPDLPARQFSEVRVPLAPRQRELYARALDGLIEDVRRADDAEFERRRLAFGERRSALLRLCSHPAAVVEGYEETPAKVAALDDLLPRHVAAREKIVLWSFYRYSLDFFAQRYADLGLVRIDGSVSATSDRREAVRRFQEDDETFVFLGNPAAAGAGLTLHTAAIAIYESFSNQAAHFMQSLDRIHRRGQQRDVEYIVLLCEGSVEEIEYDRILDKVDLQADLLGDPAPHRPTRALMLDELIDARDRLTK